MGILRYYKFFLFLVFSHIRYHNSQRNDIMPCNKAGGERCTQARLIGKSKHNYINLQKGEIDESACIHRLMALEGAIQGVKKAMLSEEVKADLKEFYQRHKK